MQTECLNAVFSLRVYLLRLRVWGGGRGLSGGGRGVGSGGRIALMNKYVRVGL